MAENAGRAPWMKWQVDFVKSLGFDPDEISGLSLHLQAGEVPKIVIYKDMPTISGVMTLPESYRFARVSREDGD